MLPCFFLQKRSELAAGLAATSIWSESLIETHKRLSCWLWSWIWSTLMWWGGVLLKSFNCGYSFHRWAHVLAMHVGWNHWNLLDACSVFPRYGLQLQQALLCYQCYVLQGCYESWQEGLIRRVHASESVDHHLSALILRMRVIGRLSSSSLRSSSSAWDFPKVLMRALFKVSYLFIAGGLMRTGCISS